MTWRCRPSAAFWLLLAVVSLHFCAPLALAAPAAVFDRPVSFSNDIAPILLSRCQGCHGAEKVKGGYRLDTFDRLMTPGETEAPAVTPREPARSELYRLLVTHDQSERMPKKGDPLPAREIDRIKRWIEQGAAYDGKETSASLTSLVVGRKHPDPPATYARPVPVTALAFSPDGEELALSGYHEVTVWGVTDGKLIRRIRNVAQQTQSIAWSPDGKRLAVAGGTPGQSGELRVFDPASGKLLHAVERSADMMLVVRFSPDGTSFAAGGADNAIRVYDAAGAKPLLLIEQHSDWVSDLSFSPDGAHLASASRDKSSRVFDARTGSMQSAYLEHGEAVTSVAWSADGKSLFTAGKDRRIHAWSLKDAKRIGLFSGINAEPLRLAALEQFVYVTATDGRVRQLTQDKREIARGLEPLADWPVSLAIHAKEKRIAVGTHAGEVRVYAIDGWKQLAGFTAMPKGEIPEAAL
jgi:dipeptidyl aminopeptidase/acylaminoacyl peptidase